VSVADHQGGIAKHRALRSEIASFAVIVDAKDDNARKFYEREGFLQLLDQPMRLYRPMADIAPLFKYFEVMRVAQHGG
jgi:hypothetical protein